MEGKLHCSDLPTSPLPTSHPRNRRTPGTVQNPSLRSVVLRMATATVLRCSTFRQTCHRSATVVSAAPIGSPFIRFFRKPMSKLVVCMASSTSGSTYGSSDENPYEVIGVSSIEGFDTIKVAYTRKRKDAEKKGDEAYVAKLEKAYDRIMMSQLQNRKQGLTFGSFKVSKDIKYADKQPIVPWGPRYSKSTVKDMRINIAISAVFSIWALIQQNAEWKPLQFLAFVFFYRIFEKLKGFEPTVSPTLNEYGEDEGKGLRMGKRILRSLLLVFGCIAMSSLGYTGLLNLIEFFGRSIPLFIYNNQESFVTLTTAITLYIMASYYR
ncbi:uncharacterized protein LOC122015692 [Zingiber officinale]|uniref:uncharacterized protein LOC122015692 n=1 Tax=Zingiber officinale TaxID=94328 RepID=UPI001C4B8D31|nr:uncharacterized protein LOC122015692 [Zingiber officinale]XP_042428641.1 uncharacterized protein LOC122015692 [Zingiber officinale]